jgi:hypothetical protein
MFKLFSSSFKGADAVSWLLARGEVSSRAEGRELCSAMLMLGLLHHVCKEHLFYDTLEYLYRFADECQPTTNQHSPRAINQ